MLIISRSMCDVRYLLLRKYLLHNILQPCFKNAMDAENML